MLRRPSDRNLRLLFGVLIQFLFSLSGALGDVLPAINSVKLVPMTLTGGLSSSTNKITLTAPAPPGGSFVELLSPDPSVASVPGQVLVAAGKISKTFTIQTSATNCPTNVSLSASCGGVKKSGH
jgi:hypothetical protein